jgi:hypothetical protein
VKKKTTYGRVSYFVVLQNRAVISVTIYRTLCSTQDRNKVRTQYFSPKTCRGHSRSVNLNCRIILEYINVYHINLTLYKNFCGHPNTFSSSKKSGIYIEHLRDN